MFIMTLTWNFESSTRWFQVNDFWKAIGNLDQKEISTSWPKHIVGQMKWTKTQQMPTSPTTVQQSYANYPNQHRKPEHQKLFTKPPTKAFISNSEHSPKPSVVMQLQENPFHFTANYSWTMLSKSQWYQIPLVVALSWWKIIKDLKFMCFYVKKNWPWN